MKLDTVLPVKILGEIRTIKKVSDYNFATWEL